MMLVKFLLVLWALRVLQLAYRLSYGEYPRQENTERSSDALSIVLLVILMFWAWVELVAS